MAISTCVLGSKYSRWHVVGVVVCVLGLVAVVASDAESHEGQGSEKLKGDVLVLMSAAGYALSNVLQEYFVKSASRTEFLGDARAVWKLVLRGRDVGV